MENKYIRKKAKAMPEEEKALYIKKIVERDKLERWRRAILEEYRRQKEKAE